MTSSSDPENTPDDSISVHSSIPGVPAFTVQSYQTKQSKYCILIPIINEGERIHHELERATNAKIPSFGDIIICDGGPQTDLRKNTFCVNTVSTRFLSKQAPASRELSCAWDFGGLCKRGYDGFITIDGNDKDSIEDVPKFHIQASGRFPTSFRARVLGGGKAINTPFIRHVAPGIHARPSHFPERGSMVYRYNQRLPGLFPSLSRAPEVQPFRDIFQTYELLAYLSVRASQLGLKACEIPVTRAYPPKGKVPTKISFFKGGNFNLFATLVKNLFRKYHP